MPVNEHDDLKRKSVHDLLEEARASLERVEPGPAYAEMQKGAVLIDTRSDDQRAVQGAIPGAVEIPLSVLEWRVDPDSDHRDSSIGGVESRIILICAQGYSSSLAAQRLQQIGFVSATDVIGGFEAWKGAGLPVEEPGPREKQWAGE